MDKNTIAFLALVRAGLWDQKVQLSAFEIISIKEIYRLAIEQSVVGLLAAGLEYAKDTKFPQEDVLNIVGDALQLEQRNMAMNHFISVIVEKMRKAGIYTLLVKGQGVAQCYVKPQWRASGDVDFLLSPDNYDKAKAYLTSMASTIDNEDVSKKHLGLTIGPWIVELHGALPFGLSSKVDRVINEAQNDVFYSGGVRSWVNEGTQVFLPSPNNDIIFVFTHFLHHFFIEGIGLRQICDWCRLLYTYRDSLDYGLLASRIRKMGLISEWKVFASLAVDTLGMPAETMPFYDVRFKDKAEKVLMRVLKSGNFGHNNDLSYRIRYKGISYKIVATWRRFFDFASLVPVFPVDAPKYFFTYMFNKA